MISRRDFLKVSSLSALGVALKPDGVFAQSSRQDRPNILWLSTEDIGPYLGCYGYENAITPTLDQMAEDGIRYTHAYTTSGVCAPNRSSIITSMYSSCLGTHHMRSGGEGTERSIKPEVPAHIRPFSEYMKEAGYYCTNNSKEDYNYNAPDSAWHESSNSAHWKNRPDDDTPFFAVFNLTLTHEGHTRAMGEDHEEDVERLKPSERQDPAKVPVPPYHPDTELVRKNWANHFELITALDYWVSDHLKALEDAGVAEDTIVFFWSDHGTGLPRQKRWLYDSGTRVPVIVRIPKKFRSGRQERPATVEDRMISSIDFGPTVMNLAGVEQPAHLQGQPFLGKNQPPPREYVYGARDRMDERYDMIRMVADKQYKYLRNYMPYKPYHQYMNTPEQGHVMLELKRLAEENALPPGCAWYTAEEKPLEELYDLEKDPHEINNIAGDKKYQDVLERMRKAHFDWMLSIKDLGVIPEPEMTDMVRREEKYPSRYAILRQSDKENNAHYRELLSAASLAGKPETEDAQALIEGLGHGSASVRYWAAIGLGNLAGRSTIGRAQLVTGLNDRAPVVRVAAARGLMRMNRNEIEALPVLIAELQSPHEWVRLNAATVLDEIGEKARPAIPELKAALEDTHNKYVVRVSNRALNQLLGTDNQVR